MEEQRIHILEAAIGLFNQYGIKFTMQQLAASLKMSKKTLYVWFADKEELFHAAVDYVFDAVQEQKQKIYEDSSMDLLTRIRRYLGTMPEQYYQLNLHQLNNLRETHPALYKHVAERLESDWEQAVDLLEKGMEENILRPFPIPIFRAMMEASLERFFQGDILASNQITYQEALSEVVSLLLDGALLRA